MAALKSKLTEVVSEALRDDCFKSVQKVEQQHIQSDVYDVYDPSVYDRREYNGGLIADDNIILTEVDNLTIEVVNITDPNPYARDGATTDKFLPELVEYGQGYNGYSYDYRFEKMGVRPFIENTIEDLQQNKQHVDGLRKGLAKRGIQVT